MNFLTTTFKKIWSFIDSLNSQTKTLIIFLIILFGVMYYSQHTNKNIISDYIEQLDRKDQSADQYTITIAPKINDCITSIQKEDQDCFNVLLLNYHNSKKSLQGLRYLYLNCIAESPKGIYDSPIKQYWSELEYIYYQDELSRIHNQGYLRINDIKDIKTSFPKLYHQLVISDAQSAAFYPIEGLDSPIGIIIVLYKHPKIYNLGFYNSKISPYIQKLSTILDYPNINSFKKNEN